MSYYNIEITSARIRALRLKLGYTQESAAELLDTDRRLLSHIENGTKGCSVDMLLRLSEVYQVSVDYILTGRPDSNMVSDVLEKAIKTLTELHSRL